MKSFHSNRKFSLDKKRFLVFSSIKKCTYAESEKYLSLKKIFLEDLLIDDELESFNITLLIFLSLINFCKIRLIYALETYNISFRAAISEAFSKESMVLKIKCLLNRGLKSILYKTLIFINGSTVIHCSKLRKKTCGTEKDFILPNLPLKYPILSNGEKMIEASKKDYIYISGAINCKDSLALMIDYCQKNNLNLVYSGHEKITHPNVIETGFIEQTNVINLIKNSYACCCFYKNNSLNQKYSASSKLLEYAYYGKTIISNKNEGVEELKNEFDISIIYVDDIQVEILPRKKTKITDFTSFCLKGLK